MAKENAVLDDIDRIILSHVRRDGRATHRELGKAAGLSPNAAGARLARLVDRGVITGVHAHVDHAALGRSLEVMIDVWLEDRRDEARFGDFVAGDDRVVDAMHVTGPIDYRIHAMVAAADDLEDLLTAMRTDAGVSQTDSRLVMSHLETIRAG